MKTVSNVLRKHYNDKRKLLYENKEEEKFENAEDILLFKRKTHTHRHALIKFIIRISFSTTYLRLLSITNSNHTLSR